MGHLEMGAEESWAFIFLKCMFLLLTLNILLIDLRLPNQRFSNDVKTIDKPLTIIT
jgi:hypothetical protein